MIRKLFIILYIVFSIAFLWYLAMPGPEFPNPPTDALRSKEPADSETPLRRAYFTNLTREEVMAHYLKEFKWGIRLNYPPEEAKTIIRDQTRSTFLEEIVHPFRESIYINGFEPKNEKDAINIEGKSWRQKIIIKQVSSAPFARIFIGGLSLGLIWLIYRSL